MAHSVNKSLTASLRRNPRPLPAIVVGGFIVGVLDLTYAILVSVRTSPFLSHKRSPVESWA
jgi:hypothetical protein